MLWIALGFALLACALHLLFFVFESLWFSRETIWRKFGATSAEDAESKRLLMFNQGCYNLLLAAGGLAGAWLVASGQGEATLLIYCLLFMVGAAAALLYSAPRMARAAAIQGGPPALALLLLVLM